MGALAKIKAALSREQRLRKRWREIVNDRQAEIREIRDAISEVNQELDKQRRRRKRNRAQDDELKAERAADRIEALEDDKDDLLLALHDKHGSLDEAEKHLRDHQERVRELLKKREARKKAREGNGNLSAHFSVEEFHCRDGTPVPQAALPALKAWCENIGEPVRARYGTVRVNSGYRTRSYNAAIGGASNSIHIYDAHPGAVAVDHWCEGGSPSTVANFEDGLSEASGLGRYASFTHSDNRHRIGWPRSRWWG
jgi:chromosome segregation ATPase